MYILTYFIILWIFLSIPINFGSFLSHRYLCKNIHRYFFNIFYISIKFKYWYICVYRYFNPWMRVSGTWFWIRVLLWMIPKFSFWGFQHIKKIKINKRLFGPGRVLGVRQPVAPIQGTSVCFLLFAFRHGWNAEGNPDGDYWLLINVFLNSLRNRDQKKPWRNLAKSHLIILNSGQK